ncbi:GCN5-related N-acetyltransferase 6, chloroplastic [Castanea sativa]|uniref:GCN5-related N-acetyltransferase 6, chloroplastic n=1 Tax=Castanea sativa TaxID=21020 RepID=UPI003F651BD5
MSSATNTISIHRPELLRFPRDAAAVVVVAAANHTKFQRVTTASWTMAMDSKKSSFGNYNTSKKNKKEEVSIIPHWESSSSSSSDFRFDRLQPSDQELGTDQKRLKFGHYVARQALLDEEFWTAAWLRAESHWENRANERYVDNFKRKFADQEFNAIKRRSRGQIGQKCTCIVTVMKEVKNVKRTVIKSVVGTLDLSIRYMLHGETFPGERVRAHLFCSINRTDPNKYGYIANLCVIKSARRRGIARNMLHFAVESAKSESVEQVYVHVHRSNIPALELYQKMGFEIVEEASSQLVEDQTFLLCLKT